MLIEKISEQQDAKANFSVLRQVCICISSKVSEEETNAPQHDKQAAAATGSTTFNGLTGSAQTVSQCKFYMLLSNKVDGPHGLTNQRQGIAAKQ